jgi:hypothetical protein
MVLLFHLRPDSLALHVRHVEAQQPVAYELQAVLLLNVAYYV